MNIPGCCVYKFETEDVDTLRTKTMTDNGNHFIYGEDHLQSKPLRKSSSVIKLDVVWDFIIGFILVFPTLVYELIRNFFMKPKSVEGKICLVTGAGRGLGRELCLRLASLGAEVICVDIREEANSETVKLIKEAGGKAHGYVCNVAKYDEVARLAGTVQKEVGRVYLLVNNAALIMVHQAGDWQPEEVTSMFNVNVISHYWTIQAFLPAMQEKNEGHIVSILSASALNGVPGFSVYGATKAAGQNMLSTLRTELNFNKANKIVITEIYPSLFNSSEDHNNFVETRIGYLSMGTVMEKTIEAILYNRTCVAIPQSLYYLFQLPKFLPEILSSGVYDIIKMNISLPNKEYKTKIVFSEISKKCVDTKCM